MSTIDQSRLLQMRSSILNQNQALQRALTEANRLAEQDGLTLLRNRRDDGLFHSYNLVDFSQPGQARAPLASHRPNVSNPPAAYSVARIGISSFARRAT